MVALGNCVNRYQTFYTSYLQKELREIKAKRIAHLIKLINNEKNEDLVIEQHERIKEVEKGDFYLVAECDGEIKKCVVMDVYDNKLVVDFNGAPLFIHNSDFTSENLIDKEW